MASRKEQKHAYYLAHREEQRKQNREHYLTHREEILKRNKEYATAHQEELRTRRKEYAAAHREEKRQYDTAYRQAHRKERRQYDTEYYRDRQEKIRQYREAHSAERREQRKEQHRTHKEEDKAYWKKYKETHQDTIRNGHFRRSYGITLAELNKIIHEQDNKCPICLSNYDHNGHKPCVDHDHTTGMVRGVICSTCNMVVLPALENTPLAALRAAARYLRDAARHRIRGRRHHEPGTPALDNLPTNPGDYQPKE